MMDQLDMLLEFHTAGDLYFEHEPTMDIPASVSELRIKLLEEELDEYRAAVEDGDIIGVADALTDLLYVLLGTYLSHGLQGFADELFLEVHLSNMSKLYGEGRTIQREDGKVLKPTAFFPPDIAGILERDN